MAFFTAYNQLPLVFSVTFTVKARQTETVCVVFSITWFIGLEERNRVNEVGKS